MTNNYKILLSEQFKKLEEARGSSVSVKKLSDKKYKIRIISTFISVIDISLEVFDTGLAKAKVITKTNYMSKFQRTLYYKEDGSEISRTEYNKLKKEYGE